MVNHIILDFKDLAIRKIDNCLKNVKKENPKCILILYNTLEQQSSVWGGCILSEFSLFKGASLSKFNRLTNSYDIKHVLENISGLGDDIDKKETKTELLETYQKFYKEYEKLYKQYLIQPINLDPLVSSTKMIAKGIIQTTNEIKWNIDNKSKATELMSHVFAIWTLQNSNSYFENKDETDPNSYLLQPRDAQIVSIFRILGIGNTDASYSQQVKDGFKTFWNLVTLKAKDPLKDALVPNLVEIGTGEGKSLTLAITSVILALLGFDISCACYSEYLSKRDYEAFEQLFVILGVEDYIKYGTFHQLCEHLINEDGNVRQMVENMILPDASGFNSDDDDGDDDGDDDDGDDDDDDEKKSPSSSQKIYKKNGRAKVLLIDEVDVFFNKQFYGQLYTPGAVLKHDCIKALTDLIWKHYISNNNTLTWKLLDVKSQKEYEECVKIFKNDWIEIIDEAIKDMLSDINTFIQTDYIVYHDKIGYKEGDQISTTTMIGYKTMWTYYYEHYIKNSISESSLISIIAIYLKCGGFSFAEIPKKFQVIMGVTGTLKALSTEERKTMDEDYCLKVYTYMPSLFGEGKRYFNKNKDILLCEITRFHEELKNEIIKRLKDYKQPRCVFVFFEDKKKLDTFYESPEFFSLQDKCKKMTEELTMSEKCSLVKRATTSGTITLLTRSFGRGTDFQVLDRLVYGNGGPHVIQTFLSEEISEEKQIMGRTARQGENGSYSMVLIQKELEKFNITDKEIEEKIQKEELYELLNEKRCEYFKKNYKETKNSIKNAKEYHDEAQKLLLSLRSNDIKNAKSMLLNYNRGATVGGTTKVAVLMDATGSMGGLITKAKNTVAEMFKRISLILQEHKMDPLQFQLQFVAYRNYNAPESELLKYSGWCGDAQTLNKFLNNINANYGIADEAMEVALHYINEDPNVTEVIVIADVGSNKKKDVLQYRKTYGGGEKYWNNTSKFKTPVFWKDEVEILKKKNIKINGFYLDPYAQTDFDYMAKETNGISQMLDINSSKGAEILTGLVSKTVLNATGGEKLVKAYESKFHV